MYKSSYQDSLKFSFNLRLVTENQSLWNGSENWTHTPIQMRRIDTNYRTLSNTMNLYMLRRV